MRLSRNNGWVRRLPVLLTLLLVAGLLAVLGSHPVDASDRPRKPRKKPTAVSLRLAPDRVTVYANGVVEPTGLVAQVTPARAGRTVSFQQRSGSTWRTLAKVRTDATGRAYRPLAGPTAAGSWAYRVAVAGTRSFRPAVSATRTLHANSNDSGVDGRGCRPTRGPVDPQATGEVHCLLQRLDTWQRTGLMGIGQQVNVSSKDAWSAPLTGIEPAVVGFDLEELSVGDKPVEDGPYVDANVQGLLDRAKAGAVLVASWHATNPVTGQPYGSPRIGLGQLTTPGNAAYDKFWADWESKLLLLQRFQDGDSDGDGDDGQVDGERTAVVVRPLHEVNGAFFWWGQPDPTTYRKIWTEMQARAASAGVHNIVWAYSGNRRTTSTKNPADYVPTQVDIGGLDSYDPETGRGNAPDVLGLEGYAAIDASPSVTRMALTEVGPHTSTDGAWNPAVISTTARRARISPLWAMLWFDDTGYAQAGTKQITSLRGGRAWLRSCFNALCYLR